MEFNIGMEDNVVVLDLAGNLIASTGEELKEHVEKLLKDNCVNIILQMSKIHFMDSSGLRFCFNINKMLSEKNGTLVFVQPNEAVSKVFHITGADKKLNITASKLDGMKLIQENIIGSTGKGV